VTLRPGRKPPHQLPETLPAAVAYIAEMSAEEFDALRDLVLNGNATLIETVGELKVQVGYLREDVKGFRDGQAQTHSYLARIETLLTQRAEDDEARYTTLSDRLRRLEGAPVNGHAAT
jgi:hypothetical protein